MQRKDQLRTRMKKSSGSDMKDTTWTNTPLEDVSSRLSTLRIEQSVLFDLVWRQVNVAADMHNPCIS